MTKIQNLIRYLKECIEIESLEDFSFPSFKINKSFIALPLDKEWSKLENSNLNITPPPEFRRKLQLGGGISSLYYGWPIYVKTAITRNNNPYAWIEPVFILKVEYEQDYNEYNLILQKEWPKINDRILKRYTENIEERMQLTDALGLPEVEILPDEGLELFWNRFNDIFSDININESIDANNLVLDDFDNFQDDGFYNRSILIPSDAPRYHKGLLRELRQLERPEYISKIKNSALDYLINGVKSEKEDIGNYSLIQISYLNRAQRNAVFNSFRNNLSVITGPPGTGKSQVVLNILANAFEKKQSVLFTSKNNKAVDVVCERILDLLDFPLNLRLGSKTADRDYTTEFLDLLDKVLSGGDKDSIRTNYERSKKQFEFIREKYFSLLNKFEQIINDRNQINELDEYLENLENRIDNKIIEKAKEVRYTKSHLIKIAFEELQKISENKIPFFCKLVSIFSKSYPYKKIHKYCMEINDLIGNSIDYPLQINENLETSFYSNYLNKVSDIYDYIRINNHLLYLRKKLNNIDINELSNQIEQFENKYIDSCRKYLESLGRHRILELSADDRKSLTNYYAVVRQLSGEYPGNKAYAKLKQQQENLFRKISKILPVWSVTNLSAAGHFPFQENIFDLVVIDEASQSDISSSIPLLFRAKKAVIIGDPQQLRHISTINKTLNNRLMQKYNLLSEDNLRFSYSIQSLYHCGRGAVGADEVTLLNEHYRSHFSIIEFSNREWYDGHLDIRTNYDNLIFPPDGHEHIEWANVVGYTFKPHGTSALNETEANKVLKLLDVLLKMYEEHMPSFGIVTPFSAQKNYIIQRLSEKYDEDTIKKHILLANTAHQFQGDERDIVIFSPVISRNASESSIGFLRSTSNLFNVSITRARSILWVVGDRNVCINAGIPYLKNFVEYIDHKKYKNIDYPIGSFESPWEKRLFETLKYEGFEPIRQYQIGPYFVDIALKIDKQKLAIEVDGKYWHSSMSGERLERDLVRDRNIRKMGWDLMRFWVHDLKYNLDSCLTRIRSKFNNNLVT